MRTFRAGAGVGVGDIEAVDVGVAVGLGEISGVGTSWAITPERNASVPHKPIRTP
jgi:hypothetical protein